MSASMLAASDVYLQIPLPSLYRSTRLWCYCIPMPEPASANLCHERSVSYPVRALGQVNVKTAALNEHIVECCTIQNGAFAEYFVQECPDEDLRAGLQMISWPSTSI